MDLKQYQIILVKFDPTIGSEINKTRPAIIISPMELNNNFKTIVISPITNTPKFYPSRLKLANNKITGWAMLDQIRTIDKSRIVKIISELSASEIINFKRIHYEIYVI